MPDAEGLRHYINSAMRRLPISHLMPFDIPVGTEHPYLITRLASGRYAIKPNITHQSLLFVGMPLSEKLKTQEDIIKNHYYSELSKESREKTNARMYRNIQREDFTFMLQSYPLYALLKNGINFGNRQHTFRIENPYGMANLYDYPTSLIRMTADIDVALLHATCKYDSQKNTWMEADGECGVLFVFELRRPFGLTAGLSNLGLMPFGRALRGKYFLYDLPDDISFDSLPNVKGFVFRQERGMSRKYLKMFDNGANLYPISENDPIAKKCKTRKENIVSRMAFEENLRRNPKDNEYDNLKRLENFDCHVDDSYDFRFRHSELKSMKDIMIRQWTDFCAKIYSPYSEERELCGILRDLPGNPYYSKYFDIDKFAGYAKLK